MGTKSMIIDISTTLFQQKGYKGVGLNEILKVCNITKGSLYHHFPNGKEELLITCEYSLNETIPRLEKISRNYPSTQIAIQQKNPYLIRDFWYQHLSVPDRNRTYDQQLRTSKYTIC